jgi:predicted kinase
MSLWRCCFVFNLGVFHFGFLLLGKIVDWLFSFALSLGMNMLVVVFSLWFAGQFCCGKGLIIVCLNLFCEVRQLREPFAEFVKNTLGSRVLLITCGLPGTWKTETSEEIAKIKGYPILRSDLIRLEVLKNEDVFDTKVAGDMRKRLSVYDELFRRADDHAQKSKQGVILDATFVTQDLRRRAAEIAAKHGLTFAILQTNCSEDKYESNALTVEAYRNNKSKFEPVDVADLKKRYPQLRIVHFTVDTEHDAPETWFVIGVEKR